MDTAVLRERLHEYINQADNKHLEAIYVLLEKELEPSYQYDAATLEMLYQRRENHQKGESKSYTAEEALDYVRKSKK